MALVLPSYATRGEVRRALQVNQATWNDAQVDRAIAAGTDSVETLCNRQFFPQDMTVSYDWPSAQRGLPWRIWFDQAELADVTVTVPVVTSGGVVIPNSAILWGHPRYAPPYTYMELNRSLSYSFGLGSTPQRDIAVTGTHGYWLKTQPAGTLAANVLIGDSTVQVGAGGKAGVGDVLICATERMLVTDAAFVSTTVAFTGLTTATMADNILAVPDGTKFTSGETLQIDSEWCLILNITGNNLLLKRAWDGSVLAAHTTGTIWSRRLLTVLRGQCGTAAAAHTLGDALTISVPPPLVKQLAVAEAIVALAMEPGAYAGTSGGAGDSGPPRPPPGQGLPDLRSRCQAQYGRKIRTRVI